jgi:hypothetical protein
MNVYLDYIRYLIGRYWHIIIGFTSGLLLGELIFRWIGLKS